MFRNLSTDGLGISGVQSEIIELTVTYKYSGLSTNMLELFHRAESNSVEYAFRLFESAKLKIGYFTLPVNWQDSEESYQKDLARLDKVAQVAAEIGAVRAVTVLNPYSDERPYHENFEFQRIRLTEMGEILGRHGIKLGIQIQAVAGLRKDRAFEYIHSADELLKLLSSVAQPNVGVVLDNWQWYASGSSDDLWKGLSADQVVTVQLADCTADKPLEELEDCDRTLPGETGVIDSVAIIQHLARIGYNGPVTVKPHKSCFPKTGRVQIVKACGQACLKLWSDAGLILADESLVKEASPVAKIEKPEKEEKQKEEVAVDDATAKENQEENQEAETATS